MEAIPEELQLKQFIILIESVHTWEEAIRLLRNIMLVCQTWYRYGCDWQLWKLVATKFHDYVRLLKRHQSIGVEWKTIIKERLSKVFIQQEILVGDRLSPECKYLIEIHGDGTMYLGNAVLSELIMQLYMISGNDSNYGNLVSYNGTSYMMSPFHLSQTITGGMLKIVDISNYDPFMLALTDTGNVIEFIFKPSWDTKWDTFTRPRYVEFPNDAVIDKIYAMDYAFMAIGNGYVFVWTVIDHPMPTRDNHGENIRTKPICLEILRDFYVYYIEPMHKLTRLYYVIRSSTTDMLRYKSPFKSDIVDPTALYIDIENYQVMAIIAENIFTSDEITYIADKIQTIDH
jgi:hypothetical protein